MAVPANTHYQAGSGDDMVVKGDPEFVAHIRVRNGVVEMDCRGSFGFGKSSRFDVTLPGPPHLPVVRSCWEPAM